MLAHFQKIIKAHNLKQKKFLLAVSGGVDSMVLADLFLQSKLDFIIAHCNYHLRGDDSNSDEALVKTFCDRNNIDFVSKDFDMPAILENQKTNLQNKARQLRYEWFSSLQKQYHIDWIVTAHHQDDAIETMLMNFFKGAGIDGLHGIAMFRDNIFRPILSFDKPAIYEYAQQHSITWREDVSNRKNDYTRNKIRNKLMPLLQEIFPQVKENLSNTLTRLSDAATIYHTSIEHHRKKLIEKRGNDFYIPLLKLKHHQPLATILYELLKPFQFHSAQLPDALKLMDADTGKFMISETHRLIHHRDFFIITPLQTLQSDHILIQLEDLVSNKIFSLNSADFNLEIQLVNLEKEKVKFSLNEEEAIVNFDLLSFPLILRRKKTGDYFYPIGMNNKKKKISRFLTDKKIPLHEKENTWILESDRKIVWVVGQRIDERFKIKGNTKWVLRMKST